MYGRNDANDTCIIVRSRYFEQFSFKTTKKSQRINKINLLLNKCFADIKGSL